MSSVNFKKCHANSGEAAAMIAHAARHDNKENVNYRNQDINQELTKNNSIIINESNAGIDEFCELKSSSEIYQDLKQLVAEIDKKMPPRRLRVDRVDIISYTVAAPDALKREDEDKFFAIVHDEIAKCSGGHQHVTAAFIHRDEIHDYIDPVTKEAKISRPHMHMCGVPFVCNIGINGKKFETRERMRRLNRAIDTRCKRELQVQFLTGEVLQAKNRSVEDMKLVTKTAQNIEKTRQELEIMRCELSQLNEQAKLLKDEINSLEDEKNKLLHETKSQIGLTNTFTLNKNEHVR